MSSADRWEDKGADSLGPIFTGAAGRDEDVVGGSGGGKPNRWFTSGVGDKLGVWEVKKGPLLKRLTGGFGGVDEESNDEV